MLIRFVLENVYSFGDQREFSMIPNSRLKTLNNHVINNSGIGLLKLASIYGANGAGKSNLVKGLGLLRSILKNEQVPVDIENAVYCFNDDVAKSNMVFAIEFIEQGTPLYFGMVIQGGVIVKEELYLSGLGLENDKLVYERESGKSDVLRFSKEFEADEKNMLLKQLLIEDFVKPKKPVLQLLARRDNPYFQSARKAMNWFSSTLQIIRPNSRPSALAQRVDTEVDFRKYANDLMCSFNVGIKKLNIEVLKAEEFFGEDDQKELEELIQELEDDESTMIGLRSKFKDEIIIVKENDEILAKRIKLDHEGKGGKIVPFDLEMESDGTIRMLDFIPAFRDVVLTNRVFVIDELERSIHPLLAKELVKKFSFDDKTQGQLIFTTHESNLLDQSIFRQDEIWFVEKDIDGMTDIYSLSDFKEHKTLDIQKGYLSGRYGSIPFLGNLKDLNWHLDDSEE